MKVNEALAIKAVQQFLNTVVEAFPPDLKAKTIGEVLTELMTIPMIGDKPDVDRWTAQAEYGGKFIKALAAAAPYLELAE